MITTHYIGQMVRTTLADYPYPLKIIWIDEDMIVCEYSDDAGSVHEITLSPIQLEDIQ